MIFRCEDDRVRCGSRQVAGFHDHSAHHRSMLSVRVEFVDAALFSRLQSSTHIDCRNGRGRRAVIMLITSPFLLPCRLPRPITSKISSRSLRTIRPPFTSTELPRRCAQAHWRSHAEFKALLKDWSRRRRPFFSLQ